MEKIKINSVHPEIVDFGSRQGRRIFSTAGVVRLRRGSEKSENAVLGRKMLFLDGHYIVFTYQANAAKPLPGPDF